MENINQPINQNHDEVSVDTTQNLIDALNAHFSDNPTTYTAYRQKVELLLKEHIKPLSSRSAKSADGTDWKSQIKAQFSGRGAKWVFVSLAEVEDTLKEFEAQNIQSNKKLGFVFQVLALTMVNSAQLSKSESLGRQLTIQNNFIILILKLWIQLSKRCQAHQKL